MPLLLFHSVVPKVIVNHCDFSCICYPLVKGLVKLQPVGQILPTAYFLKQIFIGTQPCLFVHIFSMVAFKIHGQN